MSRIKDILTDVLVYLTIGAIVVVPVAVPFALAKREDAKERKLEKEKLANYMKQRKLEEEKLANYMKERVKCSFCGGEKERKELFAFAFVHQDIVKLFDVLHPIKPVINAYIAVKGQMAYDSMCIEC